MLGYREPPGAAAATARVVAPDFLPADV
jgi:hypothetical protein